MKIGIFDSGLGGLIIAKAVITELPRYDYLYLGDTKNLPYGEKSPAEIYSCTKKAADFLFEQDCKLIILACNTASAWALRRLQQEYLPKHYPDRRILGVIIPTLEEADKNHLSKKIGVIATKSTVNSHIYKKELVKIDAQAKVVELATPKLATLIERNALPEAKNAVKLALKPLLKQHIRALILGCTHYPILKNSVRKAVGKNIKVVSQDEIIPKSLKIYLARHTEIKKALSQTASRQFFATRLNNNFLKVAKRLFNKTIKLQAVSLWP